MKTKIIYISGNEVFDMADIRAAFEEVRVALNLDKNTVLFGVPVDQDDAGLSKSTDESILNQTIENAKSIEPEETPQTPENDIVDETPDIEPVVEKKRGRARKAIENEKEDIVSTPETSLTEDAEKIVPILSILSAKDDEPGEENTVEPEIIEDVIEDIPESEENDEDNSDAEESDAQTNLEKLLSEMKPLDEDALDIPITKDADDSPEEENIDATLEQLATEFVQTQDKIASTTKSTTRNKIGKLRNILPFKQSKHADQGLGDLFGWAGVAANDEEFSVPGFFTTSSKK
jgi:hypothetical protein